MSQEAVTLTDRQVQMIADALAQGINDGLKEALAAHVNDTKIFEAVVKGTQLAFDVLYPSQIENAITIGTREAMEDKAPY